MSHLHPLRELASRPIFKAAMAVLSVLCAAPGSCGGGGGLAGDDYIVPDQTTQALTAAQVAIIMNQAGNEAVARGTPAFVAVVDRVGNVLGVTQINVGAKTPPTAGVSATCAGAFCTKITSPDSTSGGLEGVLVPTVAAAISKAITGAYLSSGGNAFTTRTANQIIQQNFPLQDNGQPGGPLFGVQFSQLACSDLSTISGTVAGGVTNGPHRSPLGLSADPGGMPLYIQGVLVGGIGVMSEATYSINPFPTADDADNADEGIALAGQSGFQPNPAIEASNVAVGGVTLDYAGPSVVHNSAPTAPVGGTVTPVAVAGFYTVNGGNGFYAGAQFGTAASGIVPDATLGANSFYPGTDADVLVTAADAPRYPPNVAGAALPSGDGLQITAAEAQALALNALKVAEVTRAGIRIPTNSHAQVTISVVDLDGNILAMIKTPDAPVFGTDVSLQKARSALFLSRGDPKNAYNEILALPAADASTPKDGFAYYMNAESVTQLNPPLFDQGTAFSDLAIGAFSRPYLPDGINGAVNGPLSLPFANNDGPKQWSPFSLGLETDLIVPDLVNFLTGGPASASGCGTAIGLPANASTERGSAGTATGAGAVHVTQLADGFMIFSGGFPLYRGNNELVGAIGISGDGILQDALVAFIGVQGDNAVGLGQATPLLFNAPSALRVDSGLSADSNADGRAAVIDSAGAHFTPRYIQCPPSPYIFSNAAAACGS